MANIFEIDQSFIKALDDKTARELIARLCRAELRSQSIPESSVTWGGDQRARDGGVDVRVDCMTPLQTSGFIKAKNSVFQVKAEKFTPSKIPQEIAPGGILRPTIVELKETGGSYVIVSTRDDVSDESLRLRREAILRCLSDHGMESSIQVDFYDSRRIADWAEQHPSITTWLRHKTSQPLQGWQPYGSWAYGEDSLEAEYLIDDSVRVFVPGAEAGSTITDAISQLRRELEHPVSIRIVGLSGVGKTRLVQALFDSRVCPDSVIPSSENVIYVDLADEPEPQPQSMIESLLNRQSDSIVIMDNCGSDTHTRLTKIIKRRTSRLKLITVEYDIRDDLPEDTRCYRLEGSSSEVIKQLIKTRYKPLSESDAERIAEFSDGNARVAFALASTVEIGGELSKLRSQELFKRLFQQKQYPNDELLRCAEAASLIYSFDGMDLSANGEIAHLASFAEVSTLTFSRHMAELKRRGLLQARGQWRAVLPHAISNSLAERMLESAPVDYLYDTLIEQSNERIARSFSRRLGFLHDCPQAVAIASRMLAENGILGNTTKLNEFKQQMFVNLAPLDQREALNSINRATQNDEFVSIKNHDRVKFSRVARSIAYESQYFDEATLVLKKFVLAEPKECNHNSVKDVLKSLFYCYLSGTKATPEQRCKVAETLVLSSNENERELGFSLIRAGLEVWHFSSSYGFEFGARRRDYGWHPQSQTEIKAWFRSWIFLTVSIGEWNNIIGREARIILGHALRGLWLRTRLSDELIDVAKRLNTVDGWPEGWLGVRRILQLDMQSLSPTSVTQLRELEKMLKPSDLVSEIRAFVLARGTFAYDLDEDDEFDENNDEVISTSNKHERSSIKAKNLGIRAAISPELLETLVPDICSTESGNRIYDFGYGVGTRHENMVGLLKVVRGYIEHTDRNKLSLIWVRGLLAGWKSTDSDAVEVFLDNAVTDVIWRNWFVELQVQSILDTKAFDRLLQVLDSDHCSVWQFRYLAGCRATDPLTVSQIMKLSNKLVTISDHGLFVAIDLLAMVVHCTGNKEDKYKQELGRELLQFLSFIKWSLLDDHNVNIEHDLGEILKFALGSADSEIQIELILRNMLPVWETDWIRFNDVRKSALKLFFQYFPMLTLGVVCIPDGDGSFHRVSHLVSDLYSEWPETALKFVPTQILVNWCKENSGEARFEFVADNCKLFEYQDDKSTPLVISDVAIALLEATPNKKAVVEIFISRFRPLIWSGSQANVLEARLPLFDQIPTLGDEVIHSVIKQKKSAFLDLIAEERKFEAEQERSQNTSFE